MTDNQYGYQQEKARTDALLDKYNELRSQLIMTEAQRDVAVMERQVSEKMLTIGAAAMARIMALTHDRSYVASTDILTALMPTRNEVLGD